MNRLAAVGTLVIGLSLVAGSVATETGAFDEFGVPVALLVLAGGMITTVVGIYRDRE